MYINVILLYRKGKLQLRRVLLIFNILVLYNAQDETLYIGYIQQSLFVSPSRRNITYIKPLVLPLVCYEDRTFAVFGGSVDC